MRRSTSEQERKRFYQLHQAGQSYAQIAEEFDISPGCVRMWCRRQRDGGDVHDRYYNPRSGLLSQFALQVSERILSLRRSHRHWGPASLRLNLAREADLQGLPLPSRASIGRYLHQFPEFRRIPKKSHP